MQTLPDRRSLEESPLYIRWSPDRSPIAIELKLDLVAKIVREIERADALGIETGGMLLGTPPNALFQAIRVDDFEVIPRVPEDGAVFMVDPKEHDRFLTTRWEARTKGRATVGFFRSHLRPGPLRPSLADRTLLAGEFKQQLYVMLLIQSAQPRTTALFLGSRSKLPEEPSVPEFLFDEAEFSSLPEVPATAEEETQETVSRRGRGGWYAILALLALLFIAIGLLFWSAPPKVPFFRSSEGLQLAATGDRILRITWNHDATDLGRASAAKLIIADGPNRKEIAIGLDELKLGSVQYERLTAQVQITLVLTMPDATSLIQTVTWHG